MNDLMLLKSGLEYSAILPDGHTIKYLSKSTAEEYKSTKGAEIIAPIQGPNRPICGDTAKILFT